MACSPERVQRKLLISCLFRSPGFVVPDTAVFEVVQDGSFIKAVFYSPAWRGAFSGRSTALDKFRLGRSPRLEATSNISTTMPWSSSTRGSHLRKVVDPMIPI